MGPARAHSLHFSLSVSSQSLIAVLATLLRLSPEELENVRKKRASNKGGLFGLF